MKDLKIRAKENKPTSSVHQMLSQSLALPKVVVD